MEDASPVDPNVLRVFFPGTLPANPTGKLGPRFVARALAYAETIRSELRLAAQKWKSAGSILPYEKHVFCEYLHIREKKEVARTSKVLLSSSVQELVEEALERDVLRSRDSIVGFEHNFYLSDKAHPPGTHLKIRFHVGEQNRQVNLGDWFEIIPSQRVRTKELGVVLRSSNIDGIGMSWQQAVDVGLGLINGAHLVEEDHKVAARVLDTSAKLGAPNPFADRKKKPPEHKPS